MDSLFAPPPPLKPHLQPFSFWIWLQLVLLRLYVRRVKGRGTPFLTMCDARGNVWIAAIGDASGTASPHPLAFTPSRAFQAAMGDTRTMAAPPVQRRDIATIGTNTPVVFGCGAGLGGQGGQFPLPPPDP
jgi:hypothetical protein